MANRFHLTDNGPKTCTASVRDCPIGGAHFEDKEAAELAYELKAEKKFNPLGALKKKSDPYTSHIARAEKRIRSLESDMKIRDARQKNGTLYHELRAEGITDELLEERFAVETNNRESTIGYTESEEGSVRAVGLTYGGDYKAEEEWGMAAITKGLQDGTYGPDDVLLYTKGDTTILAVKGERTYGWSANPEENDDVKRAEESARKRYNRYTPFEVQQMKWKLQNQSVADMRAQLKGKVVPLPKTRDELLSALVKLNSQKEYHTPAMGEFQTGKALVIVTKDPLEAKLMTKLKESHNNGSLRVGGSSNPFGRAALFYDERDLSRERKAGLIRDEEAQKSAQAYIADTQAKLKAKGNLYAISPDASGETEDIREARYFLNYAPQNAKQISGWFNKEQLERIADGDFSDVPKRN
jgi:hypothetical protein